MATAKATDMVQYVMNAQRAGWGYVYSGQGELYSLALAQQWGQARRAGKSMEYFVTQCARWFGKIVVDCSGLIIQAYRSAIPGYGDKTANTLYSKTVENGPIATIPEIPGLCVWKKGHIGMYIGNGKVVEAAGTNIGVVASALKAPAGITPWTNWGKLADVNYAAATTGPSLPEPPSCWLGRYLKLTSPYTQGCDVSQVQNALLDMGFSPGAIDGVFGPKTQKAVIDFQKSAGITADGIVGVNTMEALGGVWITDCYGLPSCTLEIPNDAFYVARLIRLMSPFMEGDDVREVQDALELYGYKPGSIDGIYGPKTHGAVVAFQQNKGLTVDGIVGPKTTSALGGIWLGS